MKLTFLQKKYFFEGRIDNYRCKTYLGQTLQKTIIPLLSSPLENAAETVSFYQSVLSLLDMPDGLVSGFRRFLLQIFQHLEDTLFQANPALLGLAPTQLETIVLQISIALFMIEKFPDFSEDVALPQKTVSFICKSSKFGLPPRAVEPILLGTARLIWMGHLLPGQVEQIAQAGAQLCQTQDLYLAQAGCTLTASGIMFLSLTKRRSKENYEFLFLVKRSGFNRYFVPYNFFEPSKNDQRNFFFLIFKVFHVKFPAGVRLRLSSMSRIPLPSFSAYIDGFKSSSRFFTSFITNYF